MTDLRIGYGYDVHRLVSGRALVLGGVTVPFEKGLLGHSDADVLTHAVMDALLGAAALGDIGKLFPDSDACYAGADSTALLRQVTAVLAEAGWTIVNVDATVAAQAPKLAPFILEMRERLAAAMGLDAGRVSVKATTEEGLGFTGSGEGIAAHAAALVEKTVQSSHIINSGGVVPKVNIWYNISVKMRRRVCPIRTDAPLFGIGYGGRGKEGRLEPQDYSGRAGETA